MKQYGWKETKYTGIKKLKKSYGIDCFDYYDNEVIYPIFSYTLLAILLSQLNIKLKPTLILEIKSVKQEIFEFYKNLLDDMVRQWKKFSQEYDNEVYKKNEENIEYGILDYLSDFPDNIIFFFDSTQHMAQVAKYLKDVEKDLRNGSNKYYQYLLEALPVFCTYSNEENYESNVNLNSQIYTIIPRKETVTRTRNIKVTKELGNYINNFLYKLFLKYDDIIDEESNILSIFIDSCKEQERKEEINKTIGSKYKYFCEKFTECPPYKPNTWLYFECLLLSVFSYFLDITFDIEFEEATKWSSKETKESLLNKAINAIIKPQINGIEEFEKFFNQLKNIDNFGEKILLEKPEGEAVKQFLNDEFTIGFVKETIENKKKRKILYLKKIELEKMLSDNNIDKNKFLEHMYSKQIVKVNKDGEKIRYDIKTSFKNYSSQERLYAFYI